MSDTFPAATFGGPDNCYRFFLSRRVSHLSDTAANFIMVNPSTADAFQDDNTIRRCIDYAKRWGHGKLYVTNLYPLRSTDPKALRDHAESSKVFWDNYGHIMSTAIHSDLIVLAWGRHGNDLGVEPYYHQPGRGDFYLENLSQLFAESVFCLGRNQDGSPRHPLMVRRDKTLEKVEVTP